MNKKEFQEKFAAMQFPPQYEEKFLALCDYAKGFVESWEDSDGEPVDVVSGTAEQAAKGLNKYIESLNIGHSQIFADIIAEMAAIEDDFDIYCDPDDVMLDYLKTALKANTLTDQDLIYAIETIDCDSEGTPEEANILRMLLKNELFPELVASMNNETLNLFNLAVWIRKEQKERDCSLLFAIAYIYANHFEEYRRHGQNDDQYDNNPLTIDKDSIEFAENYLHYRSEMELTHDEALHRIDYMLESAWEENQEGEILEINPEREDDEADEKFLEEMYRTHNLKDLVPADCIETPLDDEIS